MRLQGTADSPFELLTKPRGRCPSHAAFFATRFARLVLARCDYGLGALAFSTRVPEES